MKRAFDAPQLPSVLDANQAKRIRLHNVRKTPHVELSIGSEKFAGDARFLESAADRERVKAMVQRKYRIAAPLFALVQLFATIGLGTFKYGAFEVSLSG